MKPERLAEIENLALDATRYFLDRHPELAPATLELVAALREAQAANTALVNDKSHVLLAQSLEETKTQRDTLAATLERVRALAKKWEKDWETSDSVPAAGAIRNCTFELHRAVLGEEVLRRGDTEQQQQQINAAEGEEH